MSHHPERSGSILMLLLVAALGLLNQGCDDDSPGVNADASGGSGAGDSGGLEASSSMGVTDAGGSGGSGGSGGAGGTAGSAAGGGSSSASDGPAAGGTGGTDPATDAAGGSAGGPTLTCEDADPRCAVLGASSTCVGSFSTKCEDTNADGCLEFLQENCAPGACQDGACVPGAASEACGDAASVVGSGFLLAGADFGADFGHDLEFLDYTSCALPLPGAPETVLQVELEAGQTLSVVERGGLDAVVHVQQSCAADQVCVASSDDVEDEALKYTADVAETVSVVVEAYTEVPNPAWYRIRVDIDPECGNGLLEGVEDCDTGDPAVSEGCSEECLIEFGYECTETSPSLCTPVRSLGEFDAADSIEDVVSRDRVEVWEEDWWLVTFTEAVVLDLTARTRLMGAGDVNVEIRNEEGRVTAYRLTGDELEDAPIGLKPGTYLMRVYVGLTPLPDGYEVNLTLRDPGECGDGVLEPALEDCDTDGAPGCTPECAVEFDYLCDAASPTSCVLIESLGSLALNETLGPASIADSVAIGESSYRMFSLSEAAVLSGSVTSNDAAGDPEVWIHSATGGYPYGWENIGDESFTLPLAAGDYKIQVQAFAALEAGYTITLSAAP